MGAAGQQQRRHAVGPIICAHALVVGLCRQRAGSNALTAAKIDRKSFQPELKHVAVRVDKIDLAWQCAAVSACGDPVRALTTLRPLLAECRFASATFAGRRAPGGARALCPRSIAGGGIFWPGWTPRWGWMAKAWRRCLPTRVAASTNARHLAGRLACARCAWLANAALGWLGERIVSGGEMGELRAMVFARRPTRLGLTRRARMVCHCAKVDEVAIYQALAGGASPDSLRDTLGCGSGCGSCMPEVRRMAASVTKAA